MIATTVTVVEFCTCISDGSIGVEVIKLALEVWRSLVIPVMLSTSLITFKYN